MKKLLILAALLFSASNLFAQIEEYTVRRIEVEPSFGMGRGADIAVELRNNVSAYWDVGVRAGINSVGSLVDVVADYNFARPNKQVLFYVGAGVGIGDIDETDYTEGPNGSSATFTKLHVMPRAGVELFQHVRLTLSLNTYNFSSIYPIVSLGIVFGGGRKNSSAKEPGWLSRGYM